MSYEISSEIAPEKIPNRDEVLAVFKRYVKDFKVVYDQFDQYGPVLLDIEVLTDVLGETIQYQYMRAGNFSGQPVRSETTIHKVYYKDGIPQTGYNLTRYNTDTREWEEQNKPE